MLIMAGRRAGAERPGESIRAMTDKELRDQLMTLLVAGHDTTATALSGHWNG